MYKKVLTACAGFVVLLLISGMAFAGVPCAGTTTVAASGNGDCTPDAALCPAGDLDTVTVNVTVRDCYGTPLSGEMVTVTAQAKTGTFTFCENNKLVGPTTGAGETSADFMIVGGCGDLEFTATIGIVTAGPCPAITIASPDYNGDGAVNLVDFGNFAGSFLTSNSCHDYNCDGIVNLVDFGKFAGHFLDVCPP